MASRPATHPRVRKPSRSRPLHNRYACPTVYSVRMGGAGRAARARRRAGRHQEKDEGGGGPMVNCGRITALACVGLLAWLVGAAQSETPPAPPKPAGPTVARVSGPYTHANLTVFLLHGPNTLPDQK